MRTFNSAACDPNALCGRLMPAAEFFPDLEGKWLPVFCKEHMPHVVLCNGGVEVAKDFVQGVW